MFSEWTTVFLRNVFFWYFPNTLILQRWDCLTKRRHYRSHGGTFVTTSLPYPCKGGGRGGDKTKLSNSIFFAWKPWDRIVIQPLKWNCKVIFLNKPWALVRKYLRLAPEELSASMMTAAQFLEGCHPYVCATSVWHVLGSSGAKRKYLIFICLPKTWNDEEWLNNWERMIAKIEF